MKIVRSEDGRRAAALTGEIVELSPHFEGDVDRKGCESRGSEDAPPFSGTSHVQRTLLSCPQGLAARCASKRREVLPFTGRRGIAAFKSRSVKFLEVLATGPALPFAVSVGASEQRAWYEAKD